MDEKLLQIREQCLDQAQNFIEAAEHLTLERWPHIIYHLSLLALEEVGKASMIGARAMTHPHFDGGWVERSLDSHRRKLQWAIWSPMVRIDPAEFEEARQFAERAHALRLASLYVDATSEITDAPPRELVRRKDAKNALDLAKARVEYEQASGTPSGRVDELTEWFLETMSDPERSRVLLSKPFIAQYELLDGDARAWTAWARDEVERQARESRELLAAELAKPGAPKESAVPRWRANAVVYTPSHSIRPKVLSLWNEKIEAVQLLWSGKKDQFTLQITLNDNQALASLHGRLTSLAKLVVACLNIGTIGYFWFERAGFEQRMFKEVRDLKINCRLEMEVAKGFWGDGRAVALEELHIDHAIHCMLTFAPLPDAQAEPIFQPYLDGIALIAKSDIFYSFDHIARHAFVASLAAAMRHYGAWSGKSEDFEASFHEEFASIIPDGADRDQMFRVLRAEGDPTESSLANLRSAKQITDLYLIQVGRRNWCAILNNQQ